jgi:hypothetical protein
MELHNRCDGRCMKEKCQNVLRKSAPRVIAFWAPKGLGICVQERRAKGFHQQLWTLFCYPSDAQGTYTIDTVLPTMVPLEKSNSGNMDTLKSTLTKTQLCRWGALQWDKLFCQVKSQCDIQRQLVCWNVKWLCETTRQEKVTTFHNKTINSSKSFRFSFVE